MISIIIPFFNERENLEKLYTELERELHILKIDYEIIFINDGSTDNSETVIEKLKKDNIRLISFRKRSGKGKALNAGLDQARGDLICFMDADLQDDPKDLQKFMAKINEGYDFVNGYRSLRKENGIVKLYSKIANSFLRSMLKSPLSDINCGFKVFKRKAIAEATLYSNNFRFLPLFAFYNGYKVGQVEINNRPRIHGKSKFGPGKLIIGIMDTLTATFIYKFEEEPLHFFGIIGGILSVLGFVILLVLGIERIFFQQLLYRRPILFLGIVLLIVGIQIVMTGILGELIVYLNKKQKK